MSDVTIKTQIQIDELQIDTVAERKFTDVELVHDQGYTAQLTDSFGGIRTLWDAVAAGAALGFTLLVLTTDQPVDLEVVTENALIERAVNSIPLGKSLAFAVTADDALYDFTSDSFVGSSVGKLNLVRVRELNDVKATLRLQLFR